MSNISIYYEWEVLKDGEYFGSGSASSQEIALKEASSYMPALRELRVALYKVTREKLDVSAL